jgi:pyruvate/2-oxoglutarate dehydrogenase complex dihydrolipoamide acyltransferase (E2) component
MRVAIEMQQLGADMESVTVVEWLKKVGDDVAKGDLLVEVETEKANVEVESLDAGTLVEIVQDAGVEVEVGDVIGYLEAPDA